MVRHLVETGQPGGIVNIISMTAHCGQSYLMAYSASEGMPATRSPKNVANAVFEFICIRNLENS